ncbi:glycosyltransferase family A protein [Aeromicrobium camelliae]|uniref:glycosyltransferase family A protein n=1 Tax=Aeromicrobium camelliae TaxID=1538144 RepID=UPI001AA05BC7|nr:glycosyltransferase family A protein [Aeromicrobium camelliae]
MVIPVRDDALALGACLDRLARQTVRPLEIVVVDNASSDDTVRVARARGARVVTESHVGIPAAAARGYDAVKGDLIVRCDADTVPGRRWLERLVAPLTADPSLDAVSGLGWFHDLPRGSRHLVAAIYLGAYYAATHLALGHTSLWGSNMAFRRSSWDVAREGVHRTDAEVHDDLDLAFALGPEARIRLVPVTVGVSARSLRGRSQRRRRLDRAWRTLRVNWAVRPPWIRWRDRYQPIVAQMSNWVTKNPVR